MKTPKDEPKNGPKRTRNAPKYVTPVDPLVADMVNEFDDDLREDFEERAAIMEFDGNLERGYAECLALVDVLTRHPEALTGVIPVRVERDGAEQWFLTTHLDCARRHLIATNRDDPGAFAVAAIIDEQFGGIALLSPGKQSVDD